MRTSSSISWKRIEAFQKQIKRMTTSVIVRVNSHQKSSEDEFLFYLSSSCCCCSSLVESEKKEKRNSSKPLIILKYRQVIQNYVKSFTFYDSSLNSIHFFIANQFDSRRISSNKHDEYRVHDHRH